MEKFCTCTKAQRRLYADRCLNCDLPIEGMANVISSQVFDTTKATTIVLEGRRIDVSGNSAQIMDLEDTKVADTVHGYSAGDLMAKVVKWLVARGAAPIITEAARVKAAKDEILGILRRRQSASGPAYWNITTHVRMDFEARRMNKDRFMPALFALYGDGDVEFKDGLNRLRIKQEG